MASGPSMSDDTFQYQGSPCTTCNLGWRTPTSRWNPEIDNLSNPRHSPTCGGLDIYKPIGAKAPGKQPGEVWVKFTVVEVMTALAPKRSYSCKLNRYMNLHAPSYVLKARLSRGESRKRCAHWPSLLFYLLEQGWTFPVLFAEFPPPPAPPYDSLGCRPFLSPPLPPSLEQLAQTPYRPATMNQVAKKGHMGH